MTPHVFVHARFVFSFVYKDFVFTSGTKENTSTVNSLYCGHPRDHELVSLIARARNSGKLFQSNACNSFFLGISYCPYYQGVRNSEVSASRELTV